MTAPQGESLDQRSRLRRRRDYLRCYRNGRKKYGAFVSLHFHPRDPAEGFDNARLGITASRKVGKAVIRHRVKRRVREIFRRWEHRPFLGDVDIVVHLKPAAASASFEEIERELGRLFGKVSRLNRS